MKTSLWFDISLFGALLFLFYIIYMLRPHQIERASIDLKPDLNSNKPRRRFRAYPATLIRQAGILPESFKISYWFAKFYLSGMSVLVLLEFYADALSPMMMSLISSAGFWSVDAWLLYRRRTRRQEITHALSYFTDLIVAYLNSGLGLAKAFDQAANFGLVRNSALAQEVALLSREIEAGRDRASAFNVLATRTGVENIHRLASVIDMGHRTGASISSLLHGQAEFLRNRQRQLTTELVQRKSSQAMLPILMVSLPMFVVLVILPAGLQIQQVYAILKTLI